MFIIIFINVIIIFFTWLKGGEHAVVPGVDQHPRRVHALPAQGGQGGAGNSIQGLNKKSQYSLLILLWIRQAQPFWGTRCRTVWSYKLGPSTLIDVRIQLWTCRYWQDLKLNFVRNLYLKQALHNDKNYNIVQTLMFILIASFITALHLSDTKWKVSAVEVEKWEHDFYYTHAHPHTDEALTVCGLTTS